MVKTLFLSLYSKNLVYLICLCVMDEGITLCIRCWMSYYHGRRSWKNFRTIFFWRFGWNFHIHTLFALVFFFLICLDICQIWGGWWQERTCGAKWRLTFELTSSILLYPVHQTNHQEGPLERVSLHLKAVSLLLKTSPRSKTYDFSAPISNWLKRFDKTRFEIMSGDSVSSNQ